MIIEALLTRAGGTSSMGRRPLGRRGLAGQPQAAQQPTIFLEQTPALQAGKKTCWMLAINAYSTSLLRKDVVSLFQISQAAAFGASNSLRRSGAL